MDDNGLRSTSRMMIDFGRTWEPASEEQLRQALSRRDEIYIQITSVGVPRLDNCGLLSAAELGKQISYESFYDKTSEVSRVRIRIHPDDFGRDLTKTLTGITKNAGENKMYLETLKEREEEANHLRWYLGCWEGSDPEFDKAVAKYLGEGYTFLQNRWPKAGLTFGEITSPCKESNLVIARRAFMYCLRNRFPNGEKVSRQLSFPEIGKIFGGKNHATVILAEREVEEALPRGCELDFGDIGGTLEFIIEALGGIRTKPQ